MNHSVNEYLPDGMNKSNINLSADAQAGLRRCSHATNQVFSCRAHISINQPINLSAFSYEKSDYIFINQSFDQSINQLINN